MYAADYIKLLLTGPMPAVEDGDPPAPWPYGGTPAPLIPTALTAGVPGVNVGELAATARLASDETRGRDRLVFSFRDSRPAHARWHSEYGFRLDVIAEPKTSIFAATRVIYAVNLCEWGPPLMRRATLGRPGVRAEARQAVHRVEWSVLLRDDDRGLSIPPPPTVESIIFLPEGYSGAFDRTETVYAVEAPGYAVD